uniref:Uncharacterized protein n=1 Tax=Romanomermis culicivorax TaxID=13658 RepID=A0A915KMW5_ROMCU
MAGVLASLVVAVSETLPGTGCAPKFGGGAIVELGGTCVEGGKLNLEWNLWTTSILSLNLKVDIPILITDLLAGTLTQNNGKGRDKYLQGQAWKTTSENEIPNEIPEKAGQSMFGHMMDDFRTKIIWVGDDVDSEGI